MYIVPSVFCNKKIWLIKIVDSWTPVKEKKKQWQAGTGDGPLKGPCRTSEWMRFICIKQARQALLLKTIDIINSESSSKSLLKIHDTMMLLVTSTIWQCLSSVCLGCVWQHHNWCCYEILVFINIIECVLEARFVQLVFQSVWHLLLAWTVSWCGADFKRTLQV